jgi:hypothetical protein
VYNAQTVPCRDRSSNCPTVGTFGSWGLYVLGVFMACVYLLGPKTNFGQSEQNPAFWIQLLIAAKNGDKISWFDPVQNQTFYSTLSLNDGSLWARFYMSFLINGLGFHLLVHALPIQGPLVSRQKGLLSNNLETTKLALFFFELSRYSIDPHWCRNSCRRNDVPGRFGMYECRKLRTKQPSFTSINNLTLDNTDVFLFFA